MIQVSSSRTQQENSRLEINFRNKKIVNYHNNQFKYQFTKNYWLLK